RSREPSHDRNVDDRNVARGYPSRRAPALSRIPVWCLPPSTPSCRGMPGMSTTPVTPGDPSSESLLPPPTTGVRDIDWNVSLSCPQCGHSGWTQWKKLRRGMRCPKCQCQFLLDRNGQILTEEELPQIKFSCPRC